MRTFVNPFRSMRRAEQCGALLSVGVTALIDVPVKSPFPSSMTFAPTDFTQSLEQLTGLDAGNPGDAPTMMVEAIIGSWKKPLNALSDDEIGRLVVQHDGYPYVLDLVWPKLEQDPLFEGGYYPGDVLSNLIRAEPDIWAERPQYQIGLKALYERALGSSIEQSSAFRESLALPEASSSLN